MGRTSFENFGKRAEFLNDSTLISGRYKIQKEAEKRILFDIIQKLDIQPNDICLDVGCGLGNILIPLSFLVKKITGIDHYSIIKKLKQIYSNNNIEFISGNFFDIEIKENFSKIIVYSVLHYLKDRDEVLKFIEKTVSLVTSGGKILFGDIPNKSRKERFLSSSIGKNFIIEWEHKLSESNSELQMNFLKKDDNTVDFDDQFILKIIKYLRENGYHSYILPQPDILPFGFTREDILVEKLR